MVEIECGIKRDDLDDIATWRIKMKKLFPIIQIMNLAVCQKNVATDSEK